MLFPVTCSDMPEIPDAIPNITTYRPGTPVEYRCKDPLIFGDGKTSATIWCSVAAQWKVPAHAKGCKSK